MDAFKHPQEISIHHFLLSGQRRQNSTHCVRNVNPFIKHTYFCCCKIYSIRRISLTYFDWLLTSTSQLLSPCIKDLYQQNVFYFLLELQIYLKFSMSCIIWINVWKFENTLISIQIIRVHKMLPPCIECASDISNLMLVEFKACRNILGLFKYSRQKEIFRKLPSSQ